MFKAILLDLDDTLLGVSDEALIPAYLQAIAQHVSHLIPPDQFIADLMRATGEMDANDGTGLTNEKAFAAVFYPALGYKVDELRPIFEQFYEDEFPNLQPVTQVRPKARALVEWAFERGLQVAIATNPIFPLTAIEQRLDWAGVPVTEFDFALVTSYENMHATKSHPAYYREILARLERQPGECLMIGDNWNLDVVPSTSIGIPTYWIAEPNQVPPVNGVSLVGQGTLTDLWDWVQVEGLSF
ncbi:MAG: HAD family hydrolase [Chloroflexi bacterium]|nr:HAD family hydrolase [Chloroflexota bacterium]